MSPLKQVMKGITNMSPPRKFSGKIKPGMGIDGTEGESFTRQYRSDPWTIQPRSVNWGAMASAKSPRRAGAFTPATIPACVTPAPILRTILKSTSSTASNLSPIRPARSCCASGIANAGEETTIRRSAERWRAYQLRPDCGPGRD